MNQVHGSMNLAVSIPVMNENETLALMEANYKLDKNRIVRYELYAYDCKGDKIKIIVHNLDEMNLDCLVEGY